MEVAYLEMTKECNMDRLFDDTLEPDSNCFPKATAFTGMLPDIDTTAPVAPWIAETLTKTKYRRTLYQRKLQRIWLGQEEWNDAPEWQKDMITEHNKEVGERIQSMLDAEPAILIRLNHWQYKSLTRKEKKSVVAHNDALPFAWRKVKEEK